jgi:hypothetical protein
LSCLKRQPPDAYLWHSSCSFPSGASMWLSIFTLIVATLVWTPQRVSVSYCSFVGCWICSHNIGSVQLSLKLWDLWKAWSIQKCVQFFSAAFIRIISSPRIFKEIRAGIHVGLHVKPSLNIT